MDVLAANDSSQALEGGESGGEIGGPDIAAVDDTRDEDLAGRKTVLDDAIDLLRPAHEVEADAIDREREECVPGGIDAVEVGLDDELALAPGSGQRLVGRRECRDLGGADIGDEDRFVKLDPTGTGGGQFFDDLDVDREHAVEQGEWVEAWLVSLGKGEERDWTDEDDLAGDARLLCLVDHDEGFGAAEGKLRFRTEFGDDVVIVGVEPLGHFHGGDGTFAGTPAGHGEVGVHTDLVFVVAVAFGAGSEQTQGVEDLVVKGEVVDGDQVKAGLLLGSPAGAVDVASGGKQVSRFGLAGPKRFEGFLQFAVLADPGIAGDGGDCHVLPPGVGPDPGSGPCIRRRPGLRTGLQREPDCDNEYIVNF